MIRGPASYLGQDPVKSQLRQIEFINKDIDHPDGIVIIDPIFQAFGKQCALPAISALNEALHPTLRRSQESALRESHEAGRFHTARVKLCRGGPFWRRQLHPRNRTWIGAVGTAEKCHVW